MKAYYLVLRDKISHDRVAYTLGSGGCLPAISFDLAKVEKAKTVLESFWPDNEYVIIELENV